MPLGYEVNHYTSFVVLLKGDNPNKLRVEYDNICEDTKMSSYYSNWYFKGVQQGLNKEQTYFMVY